MLTFLWAQGPIVSGPGAHINDKLFAAMGRGPMLFTIIHGPGAHVYSVIVVGLWAQCLGQRPHFSFLLKNPGVIQGAASSLGLRALRGPNIIIVTSTGGLCPLGTL